MRQLVTIPTIIVFSIITFSCKQTKPAGGNSSSGKMSGNPLFEGWYADPEGMILGNEYWIFPTYSAPFDEQVFMDAFSSKDLVNWEKHERIIDTGMISWARRAMWAPSIIEKEGKYYLFFSANDIQRPGRPNWETKHQYNDQYGGIGIAVASDPGGPYKDYLGKPLVSGFHNDAQPIDQFVFRDIDSTCYFFYGGWGHCNVGVLNKNFDGFVPFKNDSIFKEITPEGYVEGPVMFLRRDKYYFMWSEGIWALDSYKVAYAIADHPTGPFERVSTILESDTAIATGAGHHSVINVPGTDDWYIVYHRRPIPNKSPHHRVTCIDKLEFNEDGTIRQVKMTVEGVQARFLGE